MEITMLHTLKSAVCQLHATIKIRHKCFSSIIMRNTVCQPQKNKTKQNISPNALKLKAQGTELLRSRRNEEQGKGLSMQTLFPIPNQCLNQLLHQWGHVHTSWMWKREKHMCYTLSVEMWVWKSSFQSF